MTYKIYILAIFSLYRYDNTNVYSDSNKLKLSQGYKSKVEMSKSKM